MKIIVSILSSIIIFFTLTGCETTNAINDTATEVSDNKTITFYMIRHGETLFNTKGMAQGWCDSPLTEEGIIQAKALGKGLSDIKFTSSYSSVSERALDTTELVLEGRDINTIVSENLKEMNFGSLEAELSETLFGESFKRLIEPEGWSDVGGESWPELAKRVKKELDNAAYKGNDGDNILISTHGMSILALATEIGSDSDVLKEFDETNESGIDNCSVTIVQWKNGKYMLQSINDSSYLEKGRIIK